PGSDRLPPPPQPASTTAPTTRVQYDIPISSLPPCDRFGSPERGILRPFEPPPPPDEVDRRDHHQREQGRGDHPAHHRGRDALHGLRTRPAAPERGQEAQHDRRHRHQLGPQPIHRTVFDGPDQIGLRGATSPARDVAPGVIQIEQHDDPGLGRDAGEVIHEAAMALRLGATVGDFIDLIHVYPTMAEALKLVALSFF
ncbi:MAG: hypothetical protein C4289_17230, partial [Chloroflexota bacterium]